MKNPKKYIEERVSCETLEQLELYAHLLGQWNNKINLIGRSTSSDLWRRHFIDSFQLLDSFPRKNAHFIDIGSGAGFPGLVLAICAQKTVKGDLFEINKKKTAFLKEVIRQLDLKNISVVTSDIYKTDPFKVDLVVSRAFAPMERILPLLVYWAQANKNMRALILKGRTIANELESVERIENYFKLEMITSLTGDGVILKMDSVLDGGSNRTDEKLGKL